MKKNTIPKLMAKKSKGEKLAMLTCYDATFAKILDMAGVDILLVGDSLGMVIQGSTNTLSVTIDDTIYHTRWVAEATKQALVVADMPFMSYQISKEQALLNAGRCLKETKAEAVKLEGGEERLETISALIQAGIPVMGHIGLRPQMVHQMGGYKIQGKTNPIEKQLLKEAKLLEEAGCFSIVLEGVVQDVAQQITKSIGIPTIGIASGPHCDGQVLVLYDLLGLDPGWQPKFAKKYLNGNEMITYAIFQFVQEVQNGSFPEQSKEELKTTDEQGTIQ